MSLTTFFSEPARVAGLIVFLSIFVGVSLRKKRRVHPPFMITCFVTDLALVLYLEFSRGAVETTVGRMTTELAIHVALATVSLMLYVFLIMTGRKVLKGDDSIKPRHFRLAIAFLFVRTAVLVTAIWASATMPPVMP